MYRRVIQGIGSRFYVNPSLDLHKSILVAGTARSGTTWLGDLIAAQIPCRVMFEPFNPDLVPEYRNFHYFQYLRPSKKNQEFHDFARKVFTGEIRNTWIDRQNERIFSEYRLIKEIRANFALKWIHDNFPEVPIVFLLRHPCAVVLSRMELGWATDDDIKPFLLQSELVDDHLGKYLDMIHNAATEEEKHAIIWSISNLVPLKQFQNDRLKVVYYENFCAQPEAEVYDLFDFFGLRKSDAIIDTINRPSQTSRENSAIVTGTDKITNWKKKMSGTQIDNILRVVDEFGLGHLYGDSVLPIRNNGT